MSCDKPDKLSRCLEDMENVYVPKKSGRVACSEKVRETQTKKNGVSIDIRANKIEIPQNTSKWSRQIDNADNDITHKIYIFSPLWPIFNLN